MGIKKVEFIEHYIDTKPTEYCWRGISAHCGGIKIFDIHYIEKNHQFDEPSHFYIRPTFFPSAVFDDKSKQIDFGYIGKVYYSKEEAKEQCQVIFEKFIKLFVI